METREVGSRSRLVIWPVQSVVQEGGKILEAAMKGKASSGNVLYLRMMLCFYRRFVDLQGESLEFHEAPASVKGRAATR
jgi:hypothetical protein